MATRKNKKSKKSKKRFRKTRSKRQRGGRLDQQYNNQEDVPNNALEEPAYQDVPNNEWREQLDCPLDNLDDREVEYRWLQQTSNGLPEGAEHLSGNIDLWRDICQDFVRDLTPEQIRRRRREQIRRRLREEERAERRHRETNGGKNKTRSKRGGVKTRSKRGGDIESHEDDNFIVTIAIITHGCIINTDLDPKQNQYDLRYYSSTGDQTNTCDGNVFGRSIYHDDLIEYFRQDNPSKNDNNNNNTINELPYYFDDMPYEKVIGNPDIHSQGFIYDCLDTIAPIFTGSTVVGVWLISVHKEKLIEKNKQLVKKYEYIYPTDKNKHINLLNVEGFEKFNQIIGENKFNITSELVKNNKPLPKKENNIRNFHQWDVELNNTKERINYIRLSYLFDLIKKIAGNNCKLNVYDYTCSIMCNDCNYISNNNQEIKQGLITGIEEGKMPFFTGGKRKTRKNRRRRKKAGTYTPDSSFDEGHTDRESISVDPNEPFHADIEAIMLDNEVHELEMELLDDSFASENPDESIGSIGSMQSIESIELDDDNDDDTSDLDVSLIVGGKRKARKSKKFKRKYKRKTRRK